MKRILTVAICFAASVFIVLFSTGFFEEKTQPQDSEAGMFHQRASVLSDRPQICHMLYQNDQLIGIIRDTGRLEKMLKDVYAERYEDDFPDSRLALGNDVYLTDEESYLVYEDADDEILNYIDENHLFSLEATAISFAEDGEIYARIFARNQEIYEKAMNTYISYFVDQSSLINNSGSQPALTTYGSRDNSVSIPQTITISREYAPIEEIMKTEYEVLEYLKYGDSPQLEYYTVQEYDTVAGVGSKNYGLSATQVMNINREKITSVDQLLKEGDELCVTYFTPPIDVIVEKDSFRQMPVYFETAYVEDSNLLLGEREVRQNGINGARNVLYAERWINGVLVSGTEKSGVVIQEPQSEVIALGTQQLPDVGTGVYRFPVENPAISCGYGCYFGHEGTDIVNQYDRWGDVYASDTGVVEKNSYDGISGNYIVINHNNGYKTYYGHMREQSELQVGTVVTKGQMIGHIGMTGLATGPHVHFMVEVDDKNVDACNGYLACDTVPYQ